MINQQIVQAEMGRSFSAKRAQQIQKSTKL
jgi:hypothetical protein